MASETTPAPINGDDVPGDSTEEAPGANEDEGEFQHQDTQVVKLLQSSQKACHT